MSIISKSVKCGNFKTRNKSEASKKSLIPKHKHSEETKRKISQIVKCYLKEHPDRVPYLLNHSSKESWLESTLKAALVENGIENFQQEFQNGIYSYDFAWPEIKLDVECDGQTHLLENVKRIDFERDEYSKLCGWTILRFDWFDVRFNLIKVIEKIGLTISELQLAL